MDLTEKTLSSRLVFDGRVVHLYEDTVRVPNGAVSCREYIRHVGAVAIIPVDDSGAVVLERQYRYAVGQVLVEIPAGKLDSPTEDRLAAALRELREETGIVPREMISLGDYYGSPALIGERITLYLARGFTARGEQQLDPDETLEVFTLPLEAAVREVLSGNFPDGKTQCAILRAYHMLKEEKKRETQL